jgi:hypothetical protein
MKIKDLVKRLLELNQENDLASFIIIVTGEPGNPDAPAVTISWSEIP